MSSSNRKPPRAPSLVTLSVTLQALACAALLVHLVPVTAQQNDPVVPYGLSGSLGIGMLSTASHEGSPNRRSVVGLDFSLGYRSQDWGSVELGQRGLVWQALELGDLKLGLAAGIDPGRRTRQSSSADPTPGDSRLAGMGAVKASPEAGVMVGYGPFSLLARKSLGDRGHQGVQVDLNAEFPWALTEHVGLRLGAGVTWANQRYMQAYFGVTPAQAQSSAYRPYTPQAGVRKLEASVGAEYTLVTAWKLQGTLALTRLTGDAANSPLVARRSSPSAALGLVYSF